MPEPGQSKKSGRRRSESEVQIEDENLIPSPASIPNNDAGVNGPQNYSRAFDALVDSGEDVVGLLAYALYKQSVRESALMGNVTETKARDLPTATVQAFRSSAEQLITFVVTDAIENATPDIQRTATLTRLEANHDDIISSLEKERNLIVTHVSDRTGFMPAFFTNVAAWFASLVITALIVFLANRPSVEDYFSGSGDSVATNVNTPESSNLTEKGLPVATRNK